MVCIEPATFMADGSHHAHIQGIAYRLASPADTSFSFESLPAKVRSFEEGFRNGVPWQAVRQKPSKNQRRM
jgi:hypothetical protein